MLQKLHALHASVIRLQLRQTRHSSSIKKILETGDVSTGQQYTINGWVRSARICKKVSFITINDGSTHESLQIITQNGQTVIEGKVSTGASVCAKGILQASLKKVQPVDLMAYRLSVLGPASADHPIQKKYASAEHLREHAHLRPRTRLGSAILRIQSRVLHSVSTFFQDRGIFQVMPPIISASDCEGAGETFGLAKSEDFFGHKAGLIVSSQLHLEALAAGLGQVWTITPTFRAEKSLTARHLAEFRMIEAEICFTKSLGDVMDVVEAMIRHVTRAVVDDLEVKFLRTVTAENLDNTLNLRGRWIGILGDPWTRITYAEAMKVLQDAASTESFPAPSYASGLGIDHEKYLAQHFRGPVFVTNYPASQKPFYMLPGPDDTVECFDLLVPTMGELCGGSLREHDLASMEAKMTAAGMDVNAMSWYLDLRRYGSVSHGGFGIGWERLIAYLCGVTNVREVSAFPRWVKHCVA